MFRGRSARVPGQEARGLPLDSALDVKISSSKSSSNSFFKCLRADFLIARRSAAAALRDVTKPFMENAELGRVWRAGLENLDALSPEDQARFFHAAYQFMKALETIHYHYFYGLLDAQLWEGWRELLQHYIATPGIHYYLGQRGPVCSQRFRTFIAQLEPVPKRMTVGNLFGKEARPAV